jgi:hypothetical protein
MVNGQWSMVDGQWSKRQSSMLKILHPLVRMQPVIVFDSPSLNFTKTQTHRMILKNKKLVFLILIVLTLGFIIYDSTSQPTTSDLKGNFKEVAIYRNQNNTGPIVRIYAVSVEGQVWDEMKKYGDLMPYAKYGSTTVYFFDASKPTPSQLVPAEPHFDATFNAGCVAVYSKDPNGTVLFRESPF